MELLAHADARVVADKLVDRDVARRRELAAVGADRAAGLVVLDRVVGQVHEHAVEVHGAADETAVHDAAHLLAAREGDARLEGLGLGDGRHLGKNLHQVEGLLLKFDLAGLELVHVQDVVDEVQQVVGGLEGLAAALGALGRVVVEAPLDLEHAQDPVQGRADVVAHVAQEARL